MLSFKVHFISTSNIKTYEYYDISTSEPIINIKYLLLSDLNCESINQFVIYLQNYGYLPIDEIGELPFETLGLTSKMKHNLIAYYTNDSDYLPYYSLICSGHIKTNELIEQIGTISPNLKNNLICLPCSKLCQKTMKNMSCDSEESGSMVNEFTCFCYQYNTFCFYKNMSLQEEIVSSEGEVYNSNNHLSSILTSVSMFQLNERDKKEEEIRKKIRSRKFNFNSTINNGSRRILDYTCFDTIQALKGIFNNDLLEKFKVEVKNQVSNQEISLFKTDAFVKVLLKWFKAEFFTWCDKPICQICKNNSQCNYINSSTPNQSELTGNASRTEIYICGKCKSEVRFPRYNKVSYLCNSKTGRCGEWANLFGAVLLYFGFIVRFVDNFEDHVWNEFVSYEQKRWIHVDPCEMAFDSPLIYEQGWGRMMTYVVGYSSENEVKDITKRYVRNYKLVEERRGEESKSDLKKILDEKSRLKEKGNYLIKDEEDDLDSLQLYYNSSCFNGKFGERESGCDDWKKSRGEAK